MYNRVDSRENWKSWNDRVAAGSKVPSGSLEKEDAYDE
jgi:hypothetical protein